MRMPRETTTTATVNSNKKGIAATQWPEEDATGGGRAEEEGEQRLSPEVAYPLRKELPPPVWSYVIASGDLAKAVIKQQQQQQL